MAKLRQLSSEPGEYSEAYAAQLKALELMKATDLMGFDDSMFVACFTELRDVLSQWSRYGANGHGWIRSMCDFARTVGRCSSRMFHCHSTTPPLWKW